MSENDNTSKDSGSKIIRTSSGKTRLTASGDKKDSGAVSAGAGSADSGVNGSVPASGYGRTSDSAEAAQTSAQNQSASGNGAGSASGAAGQYSAQKNTGIQSGSASSPAGAKSAGSEAKTNVMPEQQANSGAVRSTSTGVRLGGGSSTASAASVASAQPAVGAGNGSGAGASAGAGAAAAAAAGSPESKGEQSSLGGSGSSRAGTAQMTELMDSQPSGSTQVAGSGPKGAQQSKTGGESVRASSAGVKMSGKKKKSGPRTVKLTVARLDPWSVMKMTGLLSVAIGIATIVALLVLWLVLQATGTLDSVRATMSEIAGTESADDLVSLFGLGRVLAFGFIVAIVNVVLMTALSTLFAFLYNLGASIVGGFHLTLTDD